MQTAIKLGRTLSRNTYPSPLTPTTTVSHYTHRSNTTRTMATEQHRSLDTHTQQNDRLVAAAADRNKDHILNILQHHLHDQSEGGIVLEVASGTGQHAAHFATALRESSFTWLPTETDTECLKSIRAWTSDLPNVKPPIQLDCASSEWPVEAASCCAVLCVNMCHISPFQSTVGLVQGAARVLTKQQQQPQKQGGGLLFIYGPFKVNGQPTTESNRQFDHSLRGRNPQWGLRDVSEVDSIAVEAGLERVAMHDMPANNFMLVYRKTG